MLRRQMDHFRFVAPGGLLHSSLVAGRFSPSPVAVKSLVCEIRIHRSHLYLPAGKD